LEDVTGPRGLIAGVHATLLEQALEVAADLSRIIRQAFHGEGLGIEVTKDGGGNGLLVDIQADPEVDGR